MRPSLGSCRRTAQRGTTGVEPDASDAELRKAFRLAAKRNHPDKGGDIETFKKINEAWQVLCSADTHTPGPSVLYVRRLRAPASCVLHVPEAQGSLPRDPTHCTHGRTRTSYRACRTYRVPCGAPHVPTPNPSPSPSPNPNPTPNP